ncbi:MAG: ATP synthase F0 subunit B [Holosporales bacterium]|jgi:F-type H+-transporting ATPase subunit b|nr:ATP synthase F0 subunit B [Holosporales bacterium]
MLPQLDPTFYVSQLFWAAVCVTALVVVLKRRVIPRINDVVAKRNTFIAGEKALVEAAEREMAELEKEIERLKDEGLRSAAEIMREAVVRAEATLKECVNDTKKENDLVAHETRRKLNNELMDLESTLKTQIDGAAQAICDRLFWGVS